MDKLQEIKDLARDLALAAAGKGHLPDIGPSKFFEWAKRFCDYSDEYDAWYKREIVENDYDCSDEGEGEPQSPAVGKPDLL